jgi:tetratricopeptide (TPR) repeat protein
MTVVSPPGRARWAAAAALLVSAACLPGSCGQTGPGSAPSYSAERQQADAEFEAGASRPPAPKTLYAMARILGLQGKDAECEYMLVRIIREHPDFLPAYCHLAELQLRQRRSDEAVATLRAAWRISPSDPVILNNLGMCLLLKAEYKDALDLFSQAAAAMPQDARYRANMATALGMIGRYEESLAEAHFNLAVLCEARKDYARAHSELRLSEALAPGEGRLAVGSSTQPATRPQ